MISVQNERERMQILALSCDRLQQCLVDAYGTFKGRQLDLKHVLLLAAINRNTQAKDAISSMANEAWIEDGWVLIRSMLEGCINVCYLQIAGDDEAKSFVLGEASAYEHTLKQFERVMGDVFESLDQQARDQLRQNVAEANKSVGREINPRNWSIKKLEERVKIIDEHLGLKLFQAAYREIYANGNQYVHGNYRNLAPFYLQFLGQMKLDRPSRIADVNLLLSQLAKVLLSFAIFVDETYKLSQFARLSAIASDLDRSHALSGLPMGNFTFG